MEVIISHLVGVLDHFWFFHNILGIIIPTDIHIFQRGRYTTNQISHSLFTWLLFEEYPRGRFVLCFSLKFSSPEPPDSIINPLTSHTFTAYFKWFPMNFPRIYSDFDIDLPFFSSFSSENLPLIHEEAQWFPIYLPLNTIDVPVLSLTSSTHSPVICHLAVLRTMVWWFIGGRLPPGVSRNVGLDGYVWSNWGFKSV